MTKIKDTDWLLFNIGGIDHKVSALEFKEFAKHVPLMPWEEHVANGGVVFHVKDATGTVKFEISPSVKHSEVYEIDGTYKGQINTFGPGEEVVILAKQGVANGGDGSDVNEFFAENETTTWNFGELTDVSNARDFFYMFYGCNVFNGTGMSDWNTSKASRMAFMFDGCTNFNQDLSKWCVLLDNYERFDSGCTSWEDKNKPVWGTCPRGENQ